MQAGIIDALTCETDQPLTADHPCAITATFTIDACLSIRAINLVAWVVLTFALDTPLVGGAGHISARPYASTHWRGTFDAAIRPRWAVKRGAWMGQANTTQADFTLRTAHRVATVIHALASKTGLPGRTLDVDAKVLTGAPVTCESGWAVGSFTAVDTGTIDTDLGRIEAFVAHTCVYATTPRTHLAFAT